jgi:hypothetical protein
MSRVKYPHRKQFFLGKDHATVVARISKHLDNQTPGEHHSQSASEGAIARRMIEHCATCDIFLTSISMDRNSFIDLHFD